MKATLKRGDHRWWDRAEVVTGEAHRTKTGNLVVTIEPTSVTDVVRKYHFDPEGKRVFPKHFGNPCYKVELVIVEEK